MRSWVLWNSPPGNSTGYAQDLCCMLMRFIDMIYIVLIIYQCTIHINKISLKIWRKCWFGVRFVLFLAKIHLANDMTAKMLEKYGEQVNIIIGFNVNEVIFNVGIIILACQSVLAVFFCKILCARFEKKNDIDIYWWEGYQSNDMSIGGQISISMILVVSICSTT